jgi:membrane-bound metal-dependent hydrolase YbcI (DUF457 family)
VYIEHIIYSAALAVLIGMIFSRYTGRDPSWIIIAVAFVPDIDSILERSPEALPRIIVPGTIHHGDLHTILALIIFSLLIAKVLQWFNIRFIDGLICSAIGLAAPLFEDALVYNPSYPFLWPITSHVFSTGILEGPRNLFGIANSTVVFIGIILIVCAVLVRTLVEGPGWWRVFLRGGRTDTKSSY